MRRPSSPLPYRVAGLVAAAGRSSRMGEAKALLRIDGAPFVTRLVDAFLAAGLAPVVVTLPDGTDATAVREALAGRAVTAVPNAYPDEGLSGSVRTALEHIQDVAALVLSPVDAPFASVELVRALVDALFAEQGAAAVPVVEGTRGHPVAFARGAFELLWTADAHGGPRGVLDELAPRVVEVSWNDARVTVNVNTPSDLERVRGR